MADASMPSPNGDPENRSSDTDNNSLLSRLDFFQSPTAIIEDAWEEHGTFRDPSEYCTTSEHISWIENCEHLGLSSDNCENIATNDKLWEHTSTRGDQCEPLSTNGDAPKELHTIQAYDGEYMDIFSTGQSRPPLVTIDSNQWQENGSVDNSGETHKQLHVSDEISEHYGGSGDGDVHHGTSDDILFIDNSCKHIATEGNILRGLLPLVPQTDRTKPCCGADGDSKNIENDVKSYSLTHSKNKLLVTADQAFGFQLPQCDQAPVVDESINLAPKMKYSQNPSETLGIQIDVDHMISVDGKMLDDGSVCRRGMGVEIFDQWRAVRHMPDLVRHLDDIKSQELNTYLTEFIAEAKNSDGTSCTSATLMGILRDVVLHLHEHGLSHLDFLDKKKIKFAQFQEALSRHLQSFDGGLNATIMPQPMDCQYNRKPDLFKQLHVDLPHCIMADMESSLEDLGFVSPQRWPNVSNTWIKYGREDQKTEAVPTPVPVDADPIGLFNSTSPRTTAAGSFTQTEPLDLSLKRITGPETLVDKLEMQPLDLSTKQVYDHSFCETSGVTSAQISKQSAYSFLPARMTHALGVKETSDFLDTAMDLTAVKPNLVDFSSTCHSKINLSDELSDKAPDADDVQEWWSDSPQKSYTSRHSGMSSNECSPSSTYTHYSGGDTTRTKKLHKHRPRDVKLSPWIKNHRIYEKKVAVIRRETNSTKRVTDWAVNIFREWRRGKSPFENIPSLLNMSVHEINTQLCRFLVEIRKVDGTPYPPKSLQALGQGLLRYVRNNIEYIKLEEVEIGSPDNMFKPINQVLAIEMKRFEAMGSREVKRRHRIRSGVRHQVKLKVVGSSPPSTAGSCTTNCKKAATDHPLKSESTTRRETCSKKGTKWAADLFHQWSESFHRYTIPPLENLDADQMDSYLSVFFREITDKNVSPATVPAIGYALVRHLRNHHRFDMDIMDLQDARFSQLHQTFRDLGVKMKQRRIDHKAMLEEEASQIEQRSNQSMPTETRSTMKATMWAVRVFDKWRLSHPREKIPPLLTMDMEQIKTNVTRFILEAKRSDGSYFPTNSLPFLTQGLIRHARKNPCVGNDVKPIQVAVRNQMKKLRQRENGSKSSSTLSQSHHGDFRPILPKPSMKASLSADEEKIFDSDSDVAARASGAANRQRPEAPFDDPPAVPLRAAASLQPVERQGSAETNEQQSSSIISGVALSDSPFATTSGKDGTKESTDKNTKWAIHMFEKWRLAQRIENHSIVPELEAMSVDDVNKHLAKMVTDVVKSDGSNYTSACVYSLACGMLRHLRGTGRPDLDFMNTKDERFEAFQTALFCRMKSLEPVELKERSKPTKLQVITLLSETEERHLWHARIFGNKSAKNLQYTLFYYNFKLFGVKGYVTHKNLQCKQFKVGEDEHGKFIDYWKQTPDSAKPTDPCRRYREMEDSPQIVDLYKAYLSSLGEVGSFYRRLVGLNGPVVKFSDQTIGIRALQYIWLDICEAVPQQ